MAADGAPEGTVLVADRQTAGRGRHGRSWHSPAGAGFYGSVLLRPDVPIARAHVLTFVAAVAVAETIAALGVPNVEIKWPNDVLLDGRKTSGILVETGNIDHRVDVAIAGIGVNLLREAVPFDLADRATSLEDAGVRLTNVEFAIPLLDAFDRWYATMLAGDDHAVLARWASLAPMVKDRAVTIDDGQTVFDAVTNGITPDGRLRVRRPSGEQLALAAGDVSLGGR